MQNSNLAKKYLLSECFEEYCTGIFSDELDKLGYKNQVSTNWKLNNSRHRLFGIIRTLELEEVVTDDERISMGLGFLSELNKDEVLVVKGNNSFAYFGELMTRLSIEVGVQGAVIDGLTRDTYFTQSMNFPVFAKGYSPVDIKGRGRVKDTDGDFFIDNIKVRPGDYVFADSDAVVVIPKNIFEQIISKINSAAKEERAIKESIEKGVSIKHILLNHKSF
jgi:4-hydroxy-4-methyl-2-oxoglutarate aldolase